MKENATHIRLIRKDGKPVEAEYTVTYQQHREWSDQESSNFDFWAISNRIPVTGDWPTDKNVFTMDEVEPVGQIKWPLNPWLTKDDSVIEDAKRRGWPKHRMRYALRLKATPSDQDITEKLRSAIATEPKESNDKAEFNRVHGRATPIRYRKNDRQKDFTVQDDSQSEVTVKEGEKAFYSDFDDRLKDLYLSIDEQVKRVGWKDFYFAVLRYQRESIKSAYELLPGHDKRRTTQTGS